MNKTRTAGIAGVALAGAALVGGLAVAADSGSASAAPAVQVAATGAPAPSASQPGAKAGKHHPRRALAGRALHGSFTVERKGKPTIVDVQRGTVSRADASSVTVRSTDGFEATYKLASSTHIRKDRKPATVTALPAGTKVAVVADDDGGAPVARLIRVAR